jgi:hypothetical protein
MNIQVIQKCLNIKLNKYLFISKEIFYQTYEIF